MALGWLLVFSMPAAKAQPGATVTMQTFYDELSPYGEWINDPSYGYVWRPDMGGDFRPYYTGGHWALTEYGNTWVSDYDWGWAPFHYGRWTYDDYYGWIWIPDTEWGPAWVTWRDGGGYYGWAPMGPNVSVSLSFGSGYVAPYTWWTFIPYNYVYSPTFYRYYRGPRYNQTIINQTTIINNSYHNRYVYGPRSSDFQRRVGRAPQVYNITNINRPQRTNIRGNNVNIYRPEVTSNRGTARPQRVVNAPGNRDNGGRFVQPGGNQGQMQGRGIDRQRAQQVQQQQRSQQAIENNRQQQWDRQRAQQVEQSRQQQLQQQQVQRQQVEQSRMQQVQQQMEQQRQQQVQQQQVQRQQMEQQRQQQMQQQQMQRQQMEQQRQQQMQQQQQQVQRQQMEQRQQQMQQQQMQRQQIQRQEIQQQRMEQRPQMQPQRMEQRAPEGGGHQGFRR